MAMDTSEKGFVIVHSSPNFVQIVSDKVNIGFPSSASVYGQHFLCVTMSGSANFNRYGEALLIDRPYVYAQSSVPSSLQARVPNLVKLLDNKQKVSDSTMVAVFSSESGRQFIKFSKSNSISISFYKEVVSTYLKSDLQVETWGNGAGGLIAAECSGPYSIYSNLNIKYNDKQYKYTKDHSKFGITINSARKTVFFGDINRMQSQFTRGGGTVSFDDD